MTAKDKDLIKKYHHAVLFSLIKTTLKTFGIYLTQISTVILTSNYLASLTNDYNFTFFITFCILILLGILYNFAYSSIFNIDLKECSIYTNGNFKKTMNMIFYKRSSFKELWFVRYNNNKVYLPLPYDLNYSFEISKNYIISPIEIIMDKIKYYSNHINYQYDNMVLIKNNKI